MRLVGAEPGSTHVFEPILYHAAIVDIGGGPDVASAVSNPITPAEYKMYSVQTSSSVSMPLNADWN